MSRVTQTILMGDPSGVPGNCLQAAVATLVDAPLRCVPHFAEFHEWEPVMRRFAEQYGYAVRDVQNVPHFGLIFGRTVRSDTEAHAVAVLSGQIWDPHPSRAGLTRPLRYLAWERLS